MKILEKILNNILVFFSRKKEINGDYYFDLTHHGVHLGDRLFMKEIFDYITEKKSIIKLSSRDNITSELFNAIYSKYEFIKVAQTNDKDAIVLPQSYAATLLKRRGKTKTLRFDKSKNERISKQLLRSYIKLTGSQRETKEKIFIDEVDQKIIKHDKIMLFSPYVRSGKFRVNKRKEQKLVEMAKKIKLEGYQVWLIGGEGDEDAYQTIVDRDLRGKITIAEVVEIYKSYPQLKVVCYDNFHMHLANLYDRKSYIVTRTRNNKKDECFHRKQVDSTMCSQHENINYL